MENDSNFSIFLLNDYYSCTFTNGILIRYFGTIIFIIGIISTLLSICVFTRKPLRRKSCCFYFLILAISDSIHLSTMTIEHLPYSFKIDLIVFYSIICKFTIFIIYFSNHLSNIVITLASIDRFILIYYPSHSKRFCKTSKAKWLVLIVIIILLFSTGHILYGYEKIALIVNDSQHVYDCNIRHDNLFYKSFFNFYDSYIEGICFVLIPFIIMSLCSILIIFQITGTRKTIRFNNRIHNTRLRDKDIQLCCMLIGTSFAFLFLCLPAEINDIFNYISHERSCYHWFRKVILMLMQQIYYAGHFYIYTLTSQLFRKHLYAILFTRKHQKYIKTQPISYGITDQRSSIRTENKQMKTITFNSSIRTNSDNINDNCFLNNSSRRLLPNSQ
ncbi:unnamed protein product [Rotaria sp. Silwood1]|nr:unnamed protein product [Rotaria sp. Silwood1]CAF1410695.1 unnamed protein product [Rotaria sp. Silwood1]CAF3550781.1 unnamed protein product [Rotaria sp. Silwood1]CAF3599669.1 unnamed protein product [Rotaria sp. Silwood1]CAF3610940.1 unnamed protein product [Rotaria sp. Silwood1]